MFKLKRTLLAALAVVAATASNAFPTFGIGQNGITFDSYENHYRSTTACGVVQGMGGLACLASTLNDPAGWQRVDPASTGPLSVVSGDVFAGVMVVTKTNSPGANFPITTEFTGYFAQEVDTVTAHPDPLSSSAVIKFKNVGSDPFGVLTAGEMFKLYTDAAQNFDATSAISTSASIGTAIDGTFWGSLGVTPGNENYAYTLDNLAIGGNDANFVAKSFMSLSIVNTGAAYNLGPLSPVNDTSESLFGGETIGNKLLCSAADLSNPGVLCADVIGNADIKRNDFAEDGSPWYFQVNDPLRLHMIPEPGSLALMGLALAGLGLVRRRRAA